MDYELTNEQYMVEKGGQCSLAFMHIDVPSKHGPGMILGDVFLRHYLAVFDRNDGASKSSRVGFAKSVHVDHIDKRLRAVSSGCLLRFAPLLSWAGAWPLYLYRAGGRGGG